jgi:hypothetical protein
MPEEELVPMLTVSVQNHSPVMVYPSSIALLLSDGSRMSGLRDAATGTRIFSGTPVESGKSYSFRYSVDDLRKGLDKAKIVCALATDAIGREYRSDEKAMAKVLKQLGL